MYVFIISSISLLLLIPCFTFFIKQGIRSKGRLLSFFIVIALFQRLTKKRKSTIEKLDLYVVFLFTDTNNKAIEKYLDYNIS